MAERKAHPDQEVLMKNTLILRAYVHEGKAWFTIKRQGHIMGQHILVISPKTIALLFPKLHRMESCRDYKIEVNLKLRPKRTR